VPSDDTRSIGMEEWKKERNGEEKRKKDGKKNAWMNERLTGLIRQHTMNLNGAA
jgi:hypothetical protein